MVNYLGKGLIAAALVLALGAGVASATTIGVGAFGGLSIPIVQDDTEQGTIFGLRVPVNLLPLLTVEPFFGRSSLGDKDETFGSTTYTRSGPDVTAFGVNALLTFGTPVMKFYPFVGLGSAKIERDGSEDVSDVGYNFGLGLGFSPIPKLTLHLRGELNMIATDETSRKFGNVTVGAAYDVFSVP